MVFDRQNINKDNILSTEVFDSIIQINEVGERKKAEDFTISLAEKFRKKTEFVKKYNSYKEIYLKQKGFILFPHNAPIPELRSGGYFITENDEIFLKDKRICHQIIQPIAIFKNVLTGEELVKCAFWHNSYWDFFVESRFILSHQGKIINLARKGVDVTSNNASGVVKFINEMINLNSDIIPVKSSISKLGWYGSDFIPFDSEVEYDGDDNFREAFLSIKSSGSFDEWIQEMYSVRQNKIVKILHAASLSSVLLNKLNKQSFVTMLWGTTGDGKTVAGMTAMSFWGNPDKGKLMFSLNNTDNYYYRIADFFNNLPVFCDELETYRGEINKLIMNITEGRDRGKGKAEGGVEQSKTWNTVFIMTGEHTASAGNSGGGTLNRLIEINSDGKLIEDGHKTVSIIKENYGFAGKMFVDYIKKIPKEELERMYKQKYNELLSISNTQEKQAYNMAILLLADEIACKCIFKEDKPLHILDVSGYMFTTKEIDVSERAYEYVIDECEVNKNKFNIDSNNEFWGIMNDFEITIIKSKLDTILTKGRIFTY